MITYSIIKKSQLEGALRLDAEYYQPEYLNSVLKIKSQKSKPLKDFAEKVFSGPFGSTLKSESYRTEGIPFIRIGDISDIFINKNSLVYISPEEHKRIFSTHLMPGDIVLSKIATVGRLSVISDDLGEVNISENNIGIRFKKLSQEEKVYLLFFLLSKYGQSQIFQKASGNIQLKLNVVDIENIEIPLITKKDQVYFLDLYEQIIKFREQSESLYSQAESLLLEELGLKDFENKEGLFSVANLSDLKNANRMDAEYFQSKYEKLVSKIRNYRNGFDSFDNLIEVSNKKIEINPEKEYKYIELADVNENLGMVDNIQTIKGKELPSRARMKLQKNDVIVSSVEGSTDKVALIDEDVKDLVGSTGFFILKEKYFKPEVNLILVKSLIIKSLLMREAQGTILTAIPSSSLRRIILPKLENNIQQKISELVRKSHIARKKAKELLDEAKQKVEKLIEK
ncbi:MAG: hypothetical protein ABSF55_00445 [Candidatus Staskawiczbacteria bacterium]|jgi:restriction endonuclease S subunit